jgi:hypothetical protein
MTREDIARMADEAGFEGFAELTWENVSCIEKLERFAALVTSVERELCAKLCEELLHENISKETDDWMDATLDCAKAIRSRGQA